MFCANTWFFLQRMRVKAHAYAELNDNIAIHSTNEVLLVHRIRWFIRAGARKKHIFVRIIQQRRLNTHVCATRKNTLSQNVTIALV
jgi:hypothetical protein